MIAAALPLAFEPAGRTGWETEKDLELGGFEIIVVVIREGFAFEYPLEAQVHLRETPKQGSDGRQVFSIMNKNVAEAARRIFGNLPHSQGRSGNKVLRKKIIGRKIAEVRCTRPNSSKQQQHT